MDISNYVYTQSLIVGCCFKLYCIYSSSVTAYYVVCLAKKLSQLVAQPLTAEEDTALCNYLEENPALTCQELLVMFHIQRSRYVEAIRVNRQLNERQRTLHDPQVWERSDRRNAIVNGIARSLPSCLKNLAQTFPTTLPPHHASQQLQCMNFILTVLYFNIFFNRSAATTNVNDCCP